MTADAAVLVVTWNSAADVAACLDAVLTSEGVALDVVVLDNASTDGTQALLAPYDGRAQVVVSPTNTGYATGNVLALARTTAPFVVLLNPDCVVGPSTVAQLLDHLRAQPRCGAVSARLIEPDGSPQLFARREPTFWQSIPWFLASVERWDRHHGGRLRAHREYRSLLLRPPSTAFEVDGPAAACVALRREAWGERLFDPQYPLFFNDVDLYRRLRARGWAVQVLPTATAHHGYGRSHRQVATDTKRAEQLVSLRRYARRTWRRPLPAVFDLLLRLDARVCRRLAANAPDGEHLRAQARGTLGALGLEGGTQAFLSAR